MRPLQLFLALAIGGLAACDSNYSSVLEAEKACEDWASQGVEFVLEPSGFLESIEYKGATTNRFCEKKEIRFIGYEFDLPEDDKEIFADQLIKLRSSATPKENFRIGDAYFPHGKQILPTPKKQFCSKEIYACS